MFSNIKRLSIPQEEYRLLKGYGSSDVRTIIKSGGNPLKVIEKDDRTQSEAMLLGSAFDCFVLEPEWFDKRYIVLAEGAQGPTTPLQVAFANAVIAGTPALEAYAANYKNATADKADKLYEELRSHIEAALSGLTPIPFEMSQKIAKMADSLMSHRDFEKMMYGEKQAVAIGEFEGVPFKGMSDILRPGTNCDLKTTSDWESIRNHFFWRGYDVQHVLYGELHKCDRFENVYVESVEPFRVKWVEVTPFVNEAYDKTYDAVERLAYAHNSGAWTHAREYYEGGYELL